jgi:phosphatidyl-myo-inositol alpha-mannosyltransferase
MLNRVLLSTDTVGGIWRYSIELARGFAMRGVQVTLATLGPPPAADQVAEADAVAGLELIVTDLPLDWLAENRVELAEAAHSLARIAVRSRVDTVQLHTPALLGEAIWPAPVIAAAHSCVAT